MINYISLDKCRDSFLYLIYARNANLGIFKKQNNSFVISRFKFKQNFLFEEYHWDTGEPFGTVKPVELLGPVSMSFLPTMDEKEMLDFLNNMAIVYKNKINSLLNKNS